MKRDFGEFKASGVTDGNSTVFVRRNITVASVACANNLLAMDYKNLQVEGPLARCLSAPDGIPL